MEECLYVKYNDHRLPEFRVETSIRRKAGRKFVLKRALDPNAEEHINNIASAYFKIKDNIEARNIRLPGGFARDGASVACDFVEGESFDSILFNSFLNKDATLFRGALDDYASLLKTGFNTVQSLSLGEQAKSVFGISDEAELEALSPFWTLGMADLVFENVLVDDGVYWLIDTEWVFDGTLPASFALFRSMFYFYNVKFADFDIESFVPMMPELERLGVGQGAFELYRRMDDSFQAYVSGAARRAHPMASYVKQRYSVPLLEKTIEHQRDVIRQKHEIALEKERIINDIMTSKGWRFVQSVTNSFDSCFPKGSARRRVAARLLELKESEPPDEPLALG